MTATAAPVSVTMPKLGESVVEGTVVRWLKKEGEAVKKYEPLAEVVTDKVNSEIPSPAEGTVFRLSVAEGQTVAVGVEIAQIVLGGGGTPESSPAEPPTGAPAAPEPEEPEDAETN